MVFFFAVMTDNSLRITDLVMHPPFIVCLPLRPRLLPREVHPDVPSDCPSAHRQCFPSRQHKDQAADDRSKAGEAAAVQHDPAEVALHVPAVHFQGVPILHSAGPTHSQDVGGSDSSSYHIQDYSTFIHQRHWRPHTNHRRGCGCIWQEPAPDHHGGSEFCDAATKSVSGIRTVRWREEEALGGRDSRQQDSAGPTV